MAQVGRAHRQSAALDRRGDTLATCGHQLRCYVQPPAELYTIISDPPHVVAAPNPAYDPARFDCRECGAHIRI